MPFFDFLFGKGSPKNCVVEPDRIWLSSDAKFAGIAKALAKRPAKVPSAILLIAHFPDTLARLQGIAANPTAVPTTAALATNLTPDLAAGLQWNSSTTIDFIVAERHPLPSVDAHVQDFAAALPCRVRLVHHLALDDPLLEMLSGGWVGQLLQRLGMEEDECLESKMVSRRIQQAQQELEAKAFGNTPAQSAAEWIAKNCPNLA